MKYKIGQILVLNTDIEVERALSRKKVVIPKGNKIIVGADKLAHHISNGMIQPFPEGTEFEGYNTTDLAKYLVRFLKIRFPLVDMMESYDVDEKELRDEIEIAFDEIGF